MINKMYLHIFMILVLLCIIIYFSLELLVKQRKSNPAIYCIMITGKNNDMYRNKLAQKSLENFNEQTYKNKHLIIINEGNQPVLHTIQSNVLEMHIKNHNLGEMRNLALELVPPNAIWTTWDDDDYRSPNYLEILFHALHKNNQKKYLMYCNRIDYNINTNFAYRVRIPSGTYIFFCYKDSLIKYDPIPTKEDAIVKKYILAQPETVIYENNDYRLYVRLVHQSNTSLFIKSNKTTLKQQQRPNDYLLEDTLHPEEQRYIDKIKKNFSLM
jgi:hypothetical protein